MGMPVKPAVGVVSKSAYAAHRGCSAAYVSKLIRLEKLAAPALMPDGTINVILADQMLGPSSLFEAESAAPTAPTAPAAGPNYSVERAHREAALRANAEMDLAERMAETRKRSDVERESFEVQRRLRDRVMAIPAKIADRLAVETAPRVIAHLMSKALAEALGMLADELEAEAAASPGTEATAALET